MKQIEKLIFKGFGIVYECVESRIGKMVIHNNYTLKKKVNRYLCKQKHKSS